MNVNNELGALYSFLYTSQVCNLLCNTPQWNTVASRDRNQGMEAARDGYTQMSIC